MSVQARFRAALLDAAAPVPAGLLDGAANPAGRRYAVYRNNVTVSLIEALATAFPLVEKLIGPGTFKRMATIFVRANPPDSPLMMHYGSGLPAFLEGFEPLAHVAYLPDAARLDLGMRRSYHAADSVPLTGATLAAIPQGDLGDARLPLAPTTVLIPSNWPLHDIWRYNFETGAPKPRAIPQGVLITRPEFDPAPHALGPADTAWFAALGRGETLASALDAATEVDAGFDLGAALSLALATSALTALPPEASQ